MSGQRDVPTAVNAIKGGALDFIEKPIEASAVVARVRDAIPCPGPADRGNGQPVSWPEFRGSGNLLTPARARGAGPGAAAASNKKAAVRSASARAPSRLHRARIMEKLGAKNAADLVRIVMTTQRQGQA